MKLSLTIEGSSITELASTMMTMAQSLVEQKAETPARTAHEEPAAPPKEKRKAKAPKEAEETFSTAVPEEEDEAIAEFTQEQVIRAFQKYVKGPKGSPEKAKKILTKLGAKKVTDLTADQYLDVMEQIA